MVMQNLVLVVQNTVRREDMGAGSSLIAFFRSLGGAIGVSVLGAVLATHARDSIAEGLRALGVGAASLGGRARAACRTSTRSPRPSRTSSSTRSAPGSRSRSCSPRRSGWSPSSRWR